MPRIRLDKLNEIHHRSLGALNPLKKDTTSKNQYSRDSQHRIAPPRRRDNGINVGILHPCPCLTTVNKIKEKALSQGALGLIMLYGY
jgi:hypothetical protein